MLHTWTQHELTASPSLIKSHHPNPPHACRQRDDSTPNNALQHRVRILSPHLTPVEHRDLACHRHLLAPSGRPPLEPRPWHLLLALCA